MNYEMLEKLAREAGFEQTAPLNPETIKLKQEVRDMCVSGKCARYGRSWSCPPHAGSLEECGEKIAGCREGICWIEMFLDEDGVFYPIEMGYRLSGDRMHIPHAAVCGFDSE